MYTKMALMYRAVKGLAEDDPEGGVAMPEEPAYVRIAEDLRARIHDGTYPPGTRLPTHATLMDAYDVSEITIRRAIQQLKTEGLLDTSTRAGTSVRGRPPLRRIAMDRYRSETQPQGPEPTTSFTRDQGITWDEYRLDKDYARETADEDLARLLAVRSGIEVLRRRFVFYARSTPSQISTNYLPWALVDGTDVADPTHEPWPGGTPAQLAHLGHPVTRVEESVSARMPTPDEARTLQLAPGVPVIAITRRMISHMLVGEVCRDIVIPADRVVLDYAIDL